MRPIDKSLYTDNQATYTPYGNAKDDLFQAIGQFCSYCEREGYSSALDVEHIEDKNNNPDKQYDWDNFLLGCKNCNPIKGTKAISFDEILLPNLHNTFAIFSYLESGVIIINPKINDELKSKAQILINLVGIDRLPGHAKYSTKDKRWTERKKAWELAKRYLSKFNKGKCDIETIKDLALNCGFWSIWMTVFEDHEDVKTLLVSSFPGTRSELFN
jgi:uncharacterized protein (TIGR02646 family)